MSEHVTASIVKYFSTMLFERKMNNIKTNAFLVQIVFWCNLGGRAGGRYHIPALLIAIGELPTVVFVFGSMSVSPFWWQ